MNDTPIINASEHAWTLHDPRFVIDPEVSVCPSHEPDCELTGETLIARMLECNIDRTVISHVCYYGRNNDYATHCVRTWPDRFAAIGLLVGISEGAGMVGALMAGWWEKRFRPHWVLIGFVAASIAFVTITPLLGGVFVLLVVATFGRGFAQGLTQPVTFGILSRAVDESVQGASIGLRTTGNRAAAFFVPTMMGFAVEHFGLINSFYICGGALIACTLFVALFVRRLQGFRE